MNHDASPAASSPMTNGTTAPPAAGTKSDHREADASTSPTSTLRQTCAELNAQVNAFLAAEPVNEVTARTQEQARISIQVIEKALRDYEFEELSLSYNGGKDCLVLLILYLAVLHTHFTQPNGRRKQSPEQAEMEDFPVKIPSIYAKPPDPFPQVTSFVESSSRAYHLDLTHMATNPGSYPSLTKARSHVDPPPTAVTSVAAHTTSNIPNQLLHDVSTDDADKPIISFRDAFSLYLKAHPNVRAIFVGTRRTDPHGAHLTHFDMTDGNWPRFMRIHPVIDWRLSEIWCFLKSEHLRNSETGDPLDYCQMYDEGYTSLGGVGDTLRNPKLRYIDHNGQEKFKPAFEMTEDLGERLGRE